MTVIGLTGKNGSGKGEVAALLQDRGFAYASLSDALRIELRSRNSEVSRMNLIDVGRELRARFGPSILACRIGESLEKDQDYVIDSVRNPAEVQWMKDNIPGFQLWNVRADASIRFERIKSRKRESDPDTLEAFLDLEAMEASSKDSSGQDLEGTAKLADCEIPNMSSLEDLDAAVSGLLSQADS